MPLVPGPFDDTLASEDHHGSGVLRSILSLRRSSGKHFGSPNRKKMVTTSTNRGNSNHNSSSKKKKKKKRRDCLGRIMPCQEDAPTVDEFDGDGSTTEHHHPCCDPLQLQFHSLQQDTVSLLEPGGMIDPTYVDIFYDSKDRYAVEAGMNEDLIPIGLEPDDHVMLESFELLFRQDAGGHNVIGSDYHAVPLECEEGSLSASCSSLSASERPCRAVVVSHRPETATPALQQQRQDEQTKEGAVPLRFLRACNGDEEEGRRRYQETLQWRKDNNTDQVLFEAWPSFELVKQHYPHFFHGTGRNGQPVFFEQPPKTDLKALRAGGVDLPKLLDHYAMIAEFQWQVVERDDFQRSIYIIDLAGIRMSDFVGECVDFVRTASAFTAAHYPERAGHVYVVNVPGWFRMIWNVIRPMVDEVTLEKIHILRGKEEIFEALLEQIPVENIPREYGGQSSYKLGEAPEEVLLRDWMRHNNDMAQNNKVCRHIQAGECCRFCDFTLARNY